MGLFVLPCLLARRLGVEFLLQSLLNLADMLLLFGCGRLTVLSLFVELCLPFALFLTAPFMTEFVPEGSETLEKFLRVGALGLVDFAVASELETLEEAEELGECELSEDFVGEDEFCGLLHLVLGGRVVDAEEGKGLCDVEAEPEDGGLLSKEVGDDMEGRGIGCYCLLDAHRFLIAAEYLFDVVGSEACDGTGYLVLAGERRGREAANR